MMFAQIDVIKAADHAAQQSDRWLFIACLIIGGIAFAYVLRHFMKQAERQSVEHAAQMERVVASHSQARDKYHESLVTITDKQNETSRMVAVAIDKNSGAMDRCQSAMERCVRELSRVEARSAS